MTNNAESTAWIFVSHASADLANVRLVRNYLESKNAAPLLFHLMALTDPLPPHYLVTLQTFDAFARPATAPADLANLLLSRP